jgi:hypothetical protein
LIKEEIDVFKKALPEIVFSEEFKKSKYFSKKEPTEWRKIRPNPGDIEECDDSMLADSLSALDRRVWNDPLRYTNGNLKVMLMRHTYIIEALILFTPLTVLPPQERDHLTIDNVIILGQKAGLCHISTTHMNKKKDGVIHQYCYYNTNILFFKKHND